ncbi:FAD-dependent oxidoreductase [Albibacterium sp.]|uniref:FAD-dependent oxidoreductase n=1 Tax=Albibacterium sp. TaxID=2952885 RepID=UPI002C61211B|nr:FAD-dependent oxidoreductase [Albibacterium sp.]HUH19049.1 FAD-dependent oxidoreductase [Albibacterium sp.]
MKKEHDFTESVWTANINSSRYPALANDLEVDVAIIGGGITGISAAAMLTAKGKKAVVLEAHSIGKGSTGYSTGNLYATVGERLSTIDSKHGEETMLQVVNSRTFAINFIEEQVKKHHIDCEFQRVPWHLFTTDSSKDKDEEVEKEFDAAHKANLEAINSVPYIFPFPDISTIATIDHQAQINPYKYVLGLAGSIDPTRCQIFENTKVLKVEDGTPCLVHTNNGIVKAKQVIMATHSPKGIYEVHTEMETYREFALAAKIKGSLPLEGIYWHINDSYQYSIRPYSNEEGNFLIIVGEPYLVGTINNTEECLQKVEQYLHKHFDVEDIIYRWAAQNYKSADGLPYIGTSPLQSNVFIATGFKADGLVYGTLAASIITDTIFGVENDWSKLYDPKRFTPLASAGQFIKENVNVITSLVKDYLFYGEVDQLKEIKAGEGKTLKLDDEKVAAYRDENNELHIVSSVCTHLGCIVHFNNAEKSWDCPCHGSRFTIDGEVIEGPAYTNLAKPKDTPS